MMVGSDTLRVGKGTLRYKRLSNVRMLEWTVTLPFVPMGRTGAICDFCLRNTKVLSPRIFSPVWFIKAQLKKKKNGILFLSPLLHENKIWLCLNELCSLHFSAYVSPYLVSPTGHTNTVDPLYLRFDLRLSSNNLTLLRRPKIWD